MKIRSIRLSTLSVILVAAIAVPSARCQIDANPITDANPSLFNPFTAGEVTDPNVTATGIGRGTGITGTAAANRYNANSWDTAGIDSTAYFEWTLTPTGGYAMDFSSLSGNWQRSSSGPTSYVLRSSLDGFSGDIATGTITGSGSAVSFNLSLSDPAFDAVAADITFRLYAYGATTSGGTFSINDYAFNGTVAPYVPPAGDLIWKSGVGGSGSWTMAASTDWSGGTWDPSFRAVFTGTAGNVAVSGTVQANAGILINSDGYEISGDRLELTGAVNTDAGVTGTLSVQIGGTNGFTKSGNGTLALTSVANDFTGTVSLNSGTLHILNDANLGGSSNPVAFSGGTLKITDDVTLGGGRLITGAGRYDVADGKTLTVDGEANGGFALLNSGTVIVNSISSITDISYAKAATFNATTGAFLSGNVTTTHTDGTAFLAGFYDIGSNTHVFNIGNGSADVDMDLTAGIFGSSTARIHKTGLGTLRLSGDMSGLTGGVRIGTSNSLDGGRVIVTSGNSLGAAQLQFNWGTLEAENASDFNIGISFGSLQGKAAVFAGADMSFTGSSALFETNGQQSRFNVNNTTTLNGMFFQNSGTSFVGTGLTVGGTGRFILNADSTGMTRTLTIADSVSVAVNGVLGGAVIVNNGAKLQGVGNILGAIQVSGIHAVGNSAGIQTAEAGVSYLNGSKFEWELVADSDATPGTDFDQLIVSGGAITIESGVTMDLLFNSVGSTVDWTDSFWDTDHSWTIVDNTGGGLLTGQFGLNASSEWFDANGVLLSAIDPDADFVLSAVNGDIILTYYAVPIPEPSTALFLGLAGVGLLAVRRRVRVA